MKFKKDVDFTYMGYLHKTWYADELTSGHDIQTLLPNFSQFGRGVFSNPVFFVIDYSSRQYLFLTENIKQQLGYDARQMLEGGPAFTLELFQKDYFKTYNEKAFPQTLSFLKQTAQSEHDKYIFSANYQIKNSRGKWIDVLQKNAYITIKETGLPLYGLNVVMDITGFKQDKTLIHTVERINERDLSREIIETNYYFPHEEDAIFTGQEKNVLKYLSDGLSSKQIGTKLHVSESTIITHRKNMLKKSNSKNVAELISYALINHII